MSDAACSNCGHDAKSHVRTMRGRAMAPSVCESSFYCGCKVFARDKIQAPSGSSVPEAARALVSVETRDAYRNRIIETQGLAYFTANFQIIDEAVERAVAAAVAEERATTGRRIEAVLRLCEDAELHQHVPPDTPLGPWVSTRPLRAALASPGEGE